jgi:hypothetical protein
MQRKRRGRVPSSGPPVYLGELSPSIRREIDQRVEAGVSKDMSCSYTTCWRRKNLAVFSRSLSTRRPVWLAPSNGAEAPVAIHSGPVVLSTEPLWFAASDPQNVADVFYEMLVERAVDA